MFSYKKTQKVCPFSSKFYQNTIIYNFFFHNIPRILFPPLYSNMYALTVCNPETVSPKTSSTLSFAVATSNLFSSMARLLSFKLFRNLSIDPLSSAETETKQIETTTKQRATPSIIVQLVVTFDEFLSADFVHYLFADNIQIAAQIRKQNYL